MLMRVRPSWIAATAVLALAACKDKPKQRVAPDPPRRFTLVGTNDLHGDLDSLPVLGGYLEILRATRPVLLVDAGDMFQGTMESNLNEGEVVIRAYNALGYHAAAVGNHDFDFGPVGSGVEPHQGTDVHGALKERAREAEFPLLSANVIETATGKRLAWDNVRASATVNVGGVDIGIIGVATENLRWVVRPSHFEGLAAVSIADTVNREARALRKSGAEIIVVAAHAGARCTSFVNPDDLSDCTANGEIFRVAREIEPGLVDVIVGGHKHGGIAHRVNGIAIIEAYSRGRALGRVDVELPSGGGAPRLTLFPPRDLCTNHGATTACAPGEYEGVRVVPDQRIAKIIAADVRAATAITREQLGVTVDTPLPRSQTSESPLGNLLVDLMLAARPDGDIAINNGGSLRADIDAGPLTYGDLYEAMSFDNNFAIIEMTGKRLRRDLAAAFAASEDVISIAGARVAVRCEDARGQRSTLTVALTRPDGTPIRDDDTLTVVTSDYLGIGGDGLFSVETLRSSKVVFEDRQMVRDAMAAVLRKRRGTLSGDDPALYDPASPRLRYTGTPPLACPAH